MSAASGDVVQAAAARLGDLARRDEPIGPRTTYRVGGSAALFVEVNSDKALAVTAAAVAETEIEVLVLGKGSNMLVADAGFAGLCIVLGERFATVEVDERSGVVVAGGAASSPVVARQAAKAGLGGLEWLVGIPGSIGGAVRMNAGGHGSDIAACLVDADVVHLSTGTMDTTPVGGLGLSYRHSAVEPGDVVVRARLAGTPRPVAECQSTVDEIVHWRRENQPGGRNAGSVFSNPEGDSAGRLIDAAGLKGTREGSAYVSDKHANFFQADEGGSADDVYRLIEHVRAAVLERFGVTLSTELRLIGFAAKDVQ